MKIASASASSAHCYIIKFTRAVHTHATFYHSTFGLGLACTMNMKRHEKSLSVNPAVSTTLFIALVFSLKLANFVNGTSVGSAGQVTHSSNFQQYHAGHRSSPVTPSYCMRESIKQYTALKLPTARQSLLLVIAGDVQLNPGPPKCK